MTEPVRTPRDRALTPGRRILLVGAVERPSAWTDRPSCDWIHATSALHAVECLARGDVLDAVMIDGRIPENGLTAVLSAAARDPNPVSVLVIPPGATVASSVHLLQSDGASDASSRSAAINVSPADARREEDALTEWCLDADPEVNRVLVVDDDPFAVELLKRILEQAHYEVLTATDGREAVRVLSEKGASIVITDWFMPNMDGIELCRAIRCSESLGFVHVVILTAHGNKRRLLSAFEAGADDFVSKPFDRHELLVRVRAGARIVKLERDMFRRSREAAKHNARMAVLNDRLERLATMDELTGLLNRRQALIKLNELWALATRYELPFSCVLFDIDHFKKFNDQHGHDAGDAVLRATSRVAADSVRLVDVVARIGGEEFLVICPNTDGEGAVIVADRLRSRIEQIVVPHNDLRLHVAVSLGVAERHGGTADADALLKLADNALYAAKAAGRNCVHLNRETASAS